MTAEYTKPGGRKRASIKKTMRALVPLAGIGIMIAVWALLVELSGVAPYTLPSPQAVCDVLIKDWSILGPALWTTTKTTLQALLLALAGGWAIALLLAQARWIEALLHPITVAVQVTPIIALAPLIVIYVPSPHMAQMVCAFIVAFFPIMLNTLQGLKSAERHQADLLRTYGASRWQTFRYLRIPSALPSIFAGVKIGGGLALIGAVVAEFTVGQAGRNAGLAFRLLEAQTRLNTPRVFAALVLLAVLGGTIFAATRLLSRHALRHWHESEAEQKL
ncbi:ABC transporter permease [Sinorhizobium sp. RAC02]|uniref:ABC transporter permease n=1 Tax=Sinorhizobium sp. RAC02 TaxID=1842534 RepID=UPI0008571CB1|nr:ABC transporter permease [Sinorhizobium sp. RAC02]AOF89056.1 binding--dependent transport system inner membrane component family protein [Sinorhizobium sp. RAC02]